MDQVQIAASDNFIGHSSVIADIIDGTLVSDTSILASGDVISASLQLSGAYRVPGGRMLLKSLILIDEDDQGTAVDLVFFSSNVSLGTVNGVPGISDGDHRSILGTVSVAAGDFIDFGGARSATKTAINLMLEDTGGDQALYVSAVCRSGTPTYTASGLKLRLGVEKY